MLYMKQQQKDNKHGAPDHMKGERENNKKKSLEIE